MAVIIMLIIAFWFLSNAGIIPVALAICMTIFGSISCLIKIIRVVATTIKRIDDYD